MALVGLAMLVLLPLVWGLFGRTEGLPMFGASTVAQLEGDSGSTPPREPSRAGTDDQSQVR